MSGHKLHTVIMNIENHATFNTPGVEASMPSTSLTQFAAMHTKTTHACMPVVKRLTQFSGCYITTNHLYLVTYNHTGASCTQVMGSIAATNILLFVLTLCLDKAVFI